MSIAFAHSPGRLFLGSLTRSFSGEDFPVRTNSRSGMVVQQKTVCATQHACDQAILQWAALLTDQDKADWTWTEATTNGNLPKTTTSLTRTRSSQWTGQVTSQTAIGLVGCLRLLMPTDDSPSSLAAAQVESWMQNTDQTLMPILRQGKAVCSFHVETLVEMQTCQSSMEEGSLIEYRVTHTRFWSAHSICSFAACTFHDRKEG